ncbi:Leucine Rich repeats (2 copies) [Planctomycetes bacterium CA13]|uniref:Leucine Rich repeats (2 copies) n=1 Tax=Novipirellula herctigrandis TaxID=2527986 RepID=A0A5C5YXQ6_9BACT|nr:Leucine Rich repeats (2 copies) [Planctomycetes bacterium CA13]
MANAVSRNRTILQLLVLTLVCSSALATDRTTFVIPIENRSSNVETVTNARFADEITGDGLSDGKLSKSWQAYIRLWKAHYAAPSNKAIRRYFGLPLEGKVQIKRSAGRSAPSFLRWRRASYVEFETPHFVIYSRAADQETRSVAEDMEQCYWIWTQMFFPLWEGNQQVAVTMADYDPNQSIAEFLEHRPSRLSARKKMQVVLLRDAKEYIATLGRDMPGVERSTGFYSDENRTIFLFAGHEETVATRRHELTHQLFREATRPTRSRSTRQKMPGEDSGFWLVEGIAGYFESMSVGRPSGVCDGVATLGGWDSSRLAYARYRILVGNDFMPLDELERDGRVDAQQRSDLARWYAHAITHTHFLLDGGKPSNRKWVYHRLAEIYGIESSMDGPNEQEVTVAQLRGFLSVTDQHLLDNTITMPITRLCLAGCEVTEKGLRSIPAQQELQWLDLSRLKVGSDEVIRLVPIVNSLKQLSLEATAVDGRIVDWISAGVDLEEIDLSFTPVDDELATVIGKFQKLQTLWLTGTHISDRTMDAIESLPNLQAVDVQRTKVSVEQLKKFTTARPGVKVNPLELRTERQ